MDYSFCYRLRSYPSREKKSRDMNFACHIIPTCFFFIFVPILLHPQSALRRIPCWISLGLTNLTYRGRGSAIFAEHVSSTLLEFVDRVFASECCKARRNQDALHFKLVEWLVNYHLPSTRQFFLYI